jgi:hypothetical protein
MKQTLTEKPTNTCTSHRLYRQEATILDITENICKIMIEQNISRHVLARRLKIKVARLNQILDGDVDITVRMLSDVFFVLKRSVCIKDRPLE